ncbi:MAG: T9SS type A sorting domain-containing protein [Chitinophagaceae bacterium]|nr:T9SS type A sorting domain-containing protein [Chitinophagaceae bacterium]
MKAFFTKKIIALLLFCSIAFYAKSVTVIVSGYVKDVNGLAIANKAVNIYTDSISGSGLCAYYKTVTTNPNGYYIDTLHCSATYIQLVYTSTQNCNGVLLKNVHPPIVISGTSLFRVESNFIICTNPGAPTNCLSKFNFTINGNVVQFNSNQSTSGNTTDSIIKRDWNFGNGNTITGNVKEPVQTYSNPGTYTVCLKITTANGCINTYCATIIIQPVNNNNCKAKFNFTVQGKTASFVNTSTSGSSSSNITSSYWRFGVTPSGTFLGSSTVGNPTFTFPANGNYLVCLKITTSTGCIDDTCINVNINDTIPPPPVVCQSMFNYNFTSYNTVKFNSTMSTTASNDSIIKRDWNFGNGNTLTGNIKDPIHIYQNSGTYTVCLKITTAKGCINTFCLPITVVIPPTVAPCKANFNFGVQGKTVSFVSTSNSSGVAIANYFWKFGVNANGSALATSTLQNPVFTFPSNGTYLVCLKITTSSGCVSDTCKVVVINDTLATNIACKAFFVSSPLPNTTATGFTFKFNSANSYAASGDSIISRHWNFGDSLSSSNYLSGNIIEPTHTFSTQGVYNVCLKITTASGCVKTACLNIYVGFNSGTPSNCTSFFTMQKNGYKIIKYNSALSFAGANDSIVSRVWHFGDGTSLTGNVVSPNKTYNHAGTYTVCLKITTAKGCINNFCTPVKVVDSTSITAAFNGIKIINLYPNPTFGNISLNVRSAVNGNINALIEVFDVYNNRRILKTVTLANGNNFIQVNSSILPQGVYLIKITSNNGMDATRFIKL